MKDKATGDVHAVYQQLTDFNNDESNNVRIYDDYKGGLIFVDDSESCSIIPKCDSGHIIVRFEAGVPRGRESTNRVCDHCTGPFSELEVASFTCNEGCDFDSCEKCYFKKTCGAQKVQVNKPAQKV